MAIRVVEFSNGDTKLERFLSKNPQTQRKSLNFDFWIPILYPPLENSTTRAAILYIGRYFRMLTYFSLHCTDCTVGRNYLVDVQIIRRTLDGSGFLLLANFDFFRSK